MVFKPGDPKIAGRAKGTANKATSEVRKLAGKYGKEAIEKLKYIMDNAEDERAQVAAANSILDRAYGKSAMPVTGEGGTGAVQIRISGDDAKL